MKVRESIKKRRCYIEKPYQLMKKYWERIIKIQQLVTIIWQDYI